FFFQAEDGIRDFHVTGVQTCALPISVEQLNKLKHIDWQELARFLPSLKVFFLRELIFRNINPIDFLKEEYQVSADEISIFKEEKIGRASCRERLYKKGRVRLLNK